MVATALIFAKLLVYTVIGRAYGVRPATATSETKPSAPSRSHSISSPGLVHMLDRDSKLLSTPSTACHAFTQPAEKAVTSIQRLISSAATRASVEHTEKRLMSSAASRASAPSLVQRAAGPEGEFGLVTAAMPSSDRIIELALSKFPKDIDLDAHICTCDPRNLLLHVAGMVYNITSINPSTRVGYETVTLAGVGSIQVLLQGVAALDLTLENMPSTVFTVLVRTRTYDGQNNLVHMSVDFHDKIPAWICVQGALQVFVGDVGYGCINRFAINGGAETTYVERSDDEPLQPSAQEVKLVSGDSEQTFTIVHEPQDETKKLELAVLSLLRDRGGTSIQVCND